MRNGIVAAAGLAIVLAAAGGAAAQGYPERTVQIIVPATPGSSADILGRMLGDGLTVRLGKPFIIVNKPGANGVLGSADVARAKPDGYTLMHGATYSITVQPITDKDAGYTYKSFTPICQTFKNDQVIVVPPDSPFKTVRDIIEAAKQKPGALNVGIPGISTIPHLAMIQLSQIANVEFNNVPFKGPAEEIQNVRNGQLDFAAVPLTAAVGSGLAMPGIFAMARNPHLPEVPTFKEQGYSVAPLSFGGLLGPAGLPDDVKEKLGNACATVVEAQAFQTLVKETFQPADYFADAAGFARNLEKDIAEKTPLVEKLNLK
ncbi:MAG TPA: tripartite tricarboxylate transporter substrate binding protein [Xanthobacteraceae bacterium]|nr:tripartite tricarboxylate transporter substrate binding protein [Xanthobacteraceae bacterium]